MIKNNTDPPNVAEYVAITPKVEGKELKLKDPEVFFKMLGDVEFLIVKTLYYSTRALDARSIHYRVAYEKFQHAQQLRRERIAKGLEIFDPTEDYKDWFYDMNVLLQKNKAKWLSEISKKIKVPSYYLIVKTLNFLFVNGIVWRREEEGRKENFLYFLNPKVYSFLKEIEKDKMKAPIEIWNKFYKSPLQKLYEIQKLFKFPED
jgi:hypothetical protein